MPFRVQRERLDPSAGPFRRALQYAFYDWTREMPKSKRLITWVAILLQGYALYAALMWALMVPKGLLGYLLVLPKGRPGYLLAFLLYMIGYYTMNAMLTSEFVRKTQLESDQIAARQIQRTLQPERLEELPGYEVEMFYKPFREVGGDYFDVIQLPGNQTLFAVADVSGKGMAAALLAANIQALVRSIAQVEADPLALARQINKHLSRYTPSDRFATAVFIVLSRDSGKLTYVNAGHNAPIVFCAGATTFLEATGIPLGLFTGAKYEARTAVLGPGGSLLLFTDGLTDSISGEKPEDRVRDALAENSGRTMAKLKSLIDPKFNQDDVTLLLVKRSAGPASNGVEL
jgi:serine phosphatase RsbU (regulator of sigma subunit)